MESDDMSTEGIVAGARKLRNQVMAAPRSRAKSRTRSPIRSSLLDSDPDSGSSRASSASRGRGTGISRARANLRGAKEEASEVAFNQFMRDRVCRGIPPENVSDPEEVASEPQGEESSKLGTEELRAAAGRNVATIVQAVSKAGNLKGANLKRVKESAIALQELVDALVTRTNDEETRRLRADNSRLHHEVDNLKAELKAHRREFSEIKNTMAAAKAAPTPLLGADLIEELKASIVSSVGTMLDARFAGIEERLLPEKGHRPPLATDKRKQAMSSAQPVNAAPTARIGSGNLSPALASASMAAEPAGANETEATDWATVVRGKRKGKKGKAMATASAAIPAGKSTQPIRPRLPAHKNVAVVVTLQPEAAQKGVTYSQILERAEQCVNLQELGIGEGVKISRSATGARLLELPSGQTPEQAETLAARLRIALDGVASVVRPTKSASVRVTGFDDSATSEKVAAAVARVGNCLTQSIRVGEVLSGPRGVGSTTVHCPIEVAELLSAAGRLLVGWSSAEVRVLDQRPLRCFRCLGIGHTRPVCPSSVDRGDLCFRCGRDGHKSAGCTASMHCKVCADAGLPSEHVMGGRSCNPPSTRGKMVPWAQPTAVSKSRQTQDEAEMSS